jgi:hypothetical protein
MTIEELNMELDDLINRYRNLFDKPSLAEIGDSSTVEKIREELDRLSKELRTASYDGRSLSAQRDLDRARFELRLSKLQLITDEIWRTTLRKCGIQI